MNSQLFFHEWFSWAGAMASPFLHMRNLRYFLSDEKKGGNSTRFTWFSDLSPRHDQLGLGLTFQSCLAAYAITISNSPPNAHSKNYADVLSTAQAASRFQGDGSVHFVHQKQKPDSSRDTALNDVSPTNWHHMGLCIALVLDPRLGLALRRWQVTECRWPAHLFMEFSWKLCTG